jgi:hypothetical protein
MIATLITTATEAPSIEINLVLIFVVSLIVCSMIFVTTACGTTILMRMAGTPAKTWREWFVRFSCGYLSQFATFCLLWAMLAQF